MCMQCIHICTCIHKHTLSVYISYLCIQCILFIPHILVNTLYTYLYNAHFVLYTMYTLYCIPYALCIQCIFVNMCTQLCLHNTQCIHCTQDTIVHTMYTWVYNVYSTPTITHNHHISLIKYKIHNFLVNNLNSSATDR